jgi:hypothetical protein
VVLDVLPGPLAEAAAARAAGAVAAACDLPVDRLEDAVLVLQALLAGRPRDAALTVELEGVAGVVRLRVGPFADGEAERLAVAPGPGGTPLLATLAGEPEVDGGHVAVVVAERRPPQSSLL